MLSGILVILVMNSGSAVGVAGEIWYQTVLGERPGVQNMCVTSTCCLTSGNLDFIGNV